MLSRDAKHCQSSSAFLAYAVGQDIRFLHVDGSLHEAPYQTIESTSATVGLDFDYEERLIFFSVLSKTIMRVHFNGSGLADLNTGSKLHCNYAELIKCRYIFTLAYQ